MAISSRTILLYAADPPDYQIALAAAAVAGIPVSNVIGNFSNIWKSIASGNYLVIAVGANANNALYFNPCGWSNPDGMAGGQTPFDFAPQPQSIPPGPNYYENGAGQTGAHSLKLCTMLVYFAVHGAYPPGYGTTLPAPIPPSATCNSVMTSNQSCPC